MTRADRVESRLLGRRLASGIAPDYDGWGLVSVASSIVRHFGGEAPGVPLHADVLDPEALRGADRIVLVVVDGLGWDQFRRSPIARALPDHAPITTVLPSTTVAALASLATGLAPATHGLLGYRTLLPRHGAITNLLRLRPYYSTRTLFDLGVKPEEFFPFDTVVGRLGAIGVAAGVVTKLPYVESELSRMIYRGSTPDGYVGLGDLGVRARRFLDAHRGRRAFLEVYWDEIDTVAHRYGPGSDEHEAAVRALSWTLETELFPACSDGRTAVILTADHGHVHVPRERVLDLNARPNLLDDLVIPPTGEGRFAYLHVRDGRREAVRRAFLDAFDGEVDVVDAEALVAEGRFGPPPHHAEIHARTGSLVAIPRGDRKFEYRMTPTTGPSPLLGNHGGVDAAEMLVPLAVRR